ncbi:MAG TPA: VWA domain-containing protein [Chloroflexia bacterium]|nr:VWA domain-containing protein [Chloroflexia bacterium]
MRKPPLAGLLLGSLALLTACLGSAPPTAPLPANAPTAIPPAAATAGGDAFSIIAGSEQKSILDTVVVPWCQKQGYTCTYTLKGSVDQALLLQSGAVPYDAMWFASTVFWQLGDTQSRLKYVKPMFSSPVVFAGWKSVMQRLGFVGREVKVADILQAAESGQTHIWMTNPSQSNSGATAYLAFLNRFAGNGPGQALTLDQLNSSPVQDQITRLMGTVERTSPSSGDLMRSCVAQPDRCQALFTYEALVIETNQQQAQAGKEPLYAVYPSDGTSIADSPLGFVPHDNAQKEQIFQQLQAYLLSDTGVQQIRALGRRAGTIGLTIPNADKAVFNPDWGIDATRVIQPITYPDANVIRTALTLYQTSFRRPVHAIYCLDGSGSMGDNDGWNELVQGSEIIFDQTKAAPYYLQGHPGDLTSVLIFNSDVAAGPWTVTGNNAGQMRTLYENIKNHAPDDGTNLYTCLNRALDLFAQSKGETRKRLIIVMTDGQSDTDGSDTFKQRLAAAGNIPVISIAFGSDADKSQLQDLADVSGGIVVGQTDLVAALREATGYK